MWFDASEVTVLSKVIIIQCDDPDSTLFERILALLSEISRAVEVTDASKKSLPYPGLTIHPYTHKVLRDGRVLHLSNSEFEMLYCMAQQPGRIFSRKQLYTAVMGTDNLYNSNTVQNTICRLRFKLEPVPHKPTYIKTVVGAGYKFDPPT